MKVIKNVGWLVVLIYLVSSSISFAQSWLMLYHFDRNIPQTNMLNPAITPMYKITIGLPALSGINLSLNNSGIAFRDIFSYDKKKNLQLDTAQLPDKFRPLHRIQINTEVQLFYFGLHINRHYFSLGFHNVTETRIAFPREVPIWGIRGPADHRVNQQEIRLNKIKARSIIYNQISLGYNYNVNKKLSVGIRFKYLMGIAGVDLIPVNGSLRLNKQLSSLQTDSIRLHTSGVSFFTNNNSLFTEKIMNFIFNSKNGGVAFDIGATYKLNKRFSFSASIINFGFITWQDDIKIYANKPINYSFGGFKLVSVFENKGGDQLEKEEIEKLNAIVDIQQYKIKKFTTNLTGKIYLGANYKVYKNQTVRALFYLDVFREEVNTAFSLAYSVPLGQVFSGTISFAYQNEDITNIGLGLAARLGPVQLYMSSSRINSFFFPARASQGNLQTGINLVFHHVDKKKKTTPLISVKLPDSVKTIKKTPEKIGEKFPSPTISSSLGIPQHLTIKTKNHIINNKIFVSYYIIVASFRNKKNALKYSKKLKNAGFENKIDFLTDESLHQIYVGNIKNNIKKARLKVRELQQQNETMFYDAWVLPIIKMNEIEKINSSKK